MNECLKLMLMSLIKYYSNPIKLKLIYEISTNGNIVSLRILEYFLTSYCNHWDKDSKSRKVIKINGNIVYNKYKQQLLSYNKKKFDPFKRDKRIVLYTEDLYEDGTPVHLLKDWDRLEKLEHINIKCKVHDSKEKTSEYGIVTTIAQLHFFKWCVENNIISYALEHMDDIILHMKNNVKEKDKQIDIVKNNKNIHNNKLHIKLS